MSRSIALTVALLGLGTAFAAGNAVAGHILNDQVSGNRTLVTWRPDGITIAPLADIMPTGFVVLHPREITPRVPARRFQVAQRRCPNGRC
jgi:hypothetical protein